MKTNPTNAATLLRNELLSRAETYVKSGDLESNVYRSLGNPPTVLFRSHELGGQSRHGNFYPDSYAAIVDRPAHTSRLAKKHPGGMRSFGEADAISARELDSCTSSDALAMNIFCHSSIPGNGLLAGLFGFQKMPEPAFGYKAKLRFLRGAVESSSTEIDIRFQSPTRTVFVECKLTEPDFKTCRSSHVERYEGFVEAFNIPMLRTKDERYLNYQLIRNVLAARQHGSFFTLVCDERRSDLQASFHELVSAIVDVKLKKRCSLISWQQIAATLTPDFQSFLRAKYGIIPTRTATSR